MWGWIPQTTPQKETCSNALGDGGVFVLLVVAVIAAILLLLQHHQHKIKAVSK